MPRKIQPNQIVTYAKKVVFVDPNNNKNKSFWDFFFQTLAIQVLAVLLGTLTAGIGVAAVEFLGFSELGIATTSMFLQTGVNFAVNQTFDFINGTVSTQSTLLNLLFGISDIGRFGRALKYDKMLKLINEQQLLKTLGINSSVKNFYQIKQAVRLKDILLKNKMKLSFAKNVTNVEILQAISQVATSQMKSSFKTMSAAELKTFLDLEKILFKINPGLLPSFQNIDLRNYEIFFNNQAGVSFNDFLKMNDLDAYMTLAKFQGTKIGNQTLMNFNRMRVHSRFQETMLETFKRFKKTAKGKLNKINPFKYLEKMVNKLLEPINNLTANLKGMTKKYFKSITKASKYIIRKFNLIPCQADSFLLGYRFTPTSLTSEGYLEIWKKPYTSQKTGKVSFYAKVRIWTNLAQVEQFTLAKNQSIYYNENFALGIGYQQDDSKALVLAAIGLSKIVNQSSRYLKKVLALQTFLKVGVLASIKNKTHSKFHQQIDKIESKLINSLTSWIPGVNVFTPSINRYVRGKKFSRASTANDIIKPGLKRARGVKIIHV